MKVGFFRALFYQFLNFIFPNQCSICGADLPPDKIDHLCEYCWDRIAFIEPPYCRRCGRQLEKNYNSDSGFANFPGKDRPKTLYSSRLCFSCYGRRLYTNRIWSVCIYGGILRKIIHLFKYGGKTYFRKPLGRLMHRFIEKRLKGRIDMIVPVPLHRASLWKRGYNQSELLANEIGRLMDIEVNAEIIRRTKKTKPQYRLSRRERNNNIKDAFSVRLKGSDIYEKTVLLVDDVCTTGITISECSRVLKEAGARSIYGLVLAHGE